MTRPARLRSVPAPEEAPEPDMTYEYRERQRILQRDWAAVHTSGDRAPALPFFDRPTRTWRE